MPRRLEEAFKRSARKRGYAEGSDEWNRYVYGGMNKVEAKQDDSDAGSGQQRDSHGDGAGRDTD